MENKKRKTITAGGWESKTSFNKDDWPPMDPIGWKKEYAMRIQPDVSSLVYHHPYHVCAIVEHFCNMSGGQAVEKEVERQLVLNLPGGIKPWMIKRYKTNPGKPLESSYLLTMVLDVQKLRYVHPIILYKIITKLVEDLSFPQITKDSVERYIGHLTSTEHDMRVAMKK